MFTKKHFEIVAKAMRDSKPLQLAVNSEGVIAWRNVAIEFSHIFKASNPRFDRERFLTACGIDLAIRQS